MAYPYGATNAVSFGPFSASTLQQPSSIAIGASAGRRNQGGNAIALGTLAGELNQNQSTIVINATGVPLNTDADNATYMAPLRFVTASNVMAYNPTSKEVSHTNTLSTLTISSLSTRALNYSSLVGSSMNTSVITANLLYCNTISTVGGIVVGGGGGGGGGGSSSGPVAILANTPATTQSIPADTNTLILWDSADTAQTIGITGLSYLNGLFTNTTGSALPFQVDYSLELSITGGGASYIGLNGPTEAYGRLLNENNVFSNTYTILVPAGGTVGVYYRDINATVVQTGSRIALTLLTATQGQVATMLVSPTVTQALPPSASLSLVLWGTTDNTQSYGSTGLNYVNGLFINITAAILPVLVQYTLNLDSTMGGYSAIGINGSTTVYGGTYNDTNGFTNSYTVMVPAYGTLGIYYMDNGATTVQTTSTLRLTILMAGATGASPWTVSGTTASYTVGNVGIGTTAPGAPLTIRGSSASAPFGIQFVAASNSLSNTANTYDVLQRWYESTENQNYLDLMWVRTSTGSTWTTSGQRLQSRTDATWQGFIEFNGTNNNAGVTIGAGGSSTNPNDVSRVMYVTSGGTVGIGTTAPGSRLEVLGGGTTNLGGGLYTLSGTGPSPIITAQNGSISGTNPFTFTLNQTNGQIQTTYPFTIGGWYTLTFNASTASSGITIIINAIPSNTGYYTTPTLTNTSTQYSFSFVATSNTNLLLTFGGSVNGTAVTMTPFTVTQLNTIVSGNVGIGTNAPSQLLDLTNVTSLTPAIRIQNQFSAGYVSMGSVVGVNSYIGLQAGINTSSALGTPPFVVTNDSKVGIGTTAPGATLQVTNNGSSYTTGPTLSISDGVADNGGLYGMLQLTRQGGVADNKAHLTFIRNGNNVINMGYYNGLNTFGFTVGVAGMTSNTIMAFTDSGNVGIGTTNPGAKLEIAGNTIIGVVNGTSTGSGAGIYGKASGGASSGNVPGFMYGVNADFKAGDLYTAAWGGNYGAGDTNIYGGFIQDSGNNGTAGGTYRGGTINLISGQVSVWNSSGANAQTCISGDIVMYSGNVSRANPPTFSGITERMRIVGNSGLIGIGTNAPVTRLTIAPNITSTTTQGIAQYGGVHLVPSGTDNSITGITFGANPSIYSGQSQAGIICQSSSSYGTRLLLQTSGDFGQGCTTRLTLNENGRADFRSAGDGGSSLNWIAGSFGSSGEVDRVVIGSYAVVGSHAVIGAHNNALNAWATLIINPGGAVKLGFYTTDGTVTTSGGQGQISISSDRRIKEDITYLTDTMNGLEQINKLKPATFRMIGQKQLCLGYIAQDVETIIPEAVDGKKYEYRWEIDEKGNPKFDADGNIVYQLDADGNRIIRPRGLTDRAIIATQTLAIQQLSKENATLKGELAATTSQLAATTSQLAATTSQLAALTSQLAALTAWAQAQGFSA